MTATQFTHFPPFPPLFPISPNTLLFQLHYYLQYRRTATIEHNTHRLHRDKLQDTEPTTQSQVSSTQLQVRNTFQFNRRSFFYTSLEIFLVYKHNTFIQAPQDSTFVADATPWKILFS
eukprot:TRINITY_DN746_c0_g1_i6.p1 TRINITY_DN746_c0_g1~~TRINITY_DN746_c0_g1_i6.p1  ORF type:complete len:118 (+),score=1.07 TRINITY_DN746_c0_g1_i6:71-424(+)